MRRAILVLLAFAILAGAGLVVRRSWPRVPQAPRAIEPPPAPAPVEEKASVTLYFANRAYLQSGDESLPHLVAEKRRLDLAGTDEASAAVRALQATPASKGAARVIKEDLQILGVKVDRGVAYVDFARANLSGGSLQEMLLIQGVVRTLTGLPGVKAVQFLIDGRPTDTLMGHLSADKPLTAADVQ